MKVDHFEYVVRSENRARHFFRRKRWKNARIFCTACRSYNVVRILNRRYRCRRCKHRFHDFSGTYLNELQIPFRAWLWILKLFELEVSAHRIAHQVELSYPTVLKALHFVRLSIVHAESPDWLAGEVELDESYFGGYQKGHRGRSVSNKIPVMGILERNGRVRVHLLKDATAESLLSLTVKTVRRGSIVYTDKYQAYDALMFCGYTHLRVDHGKRFAQGKVYINGLEGFWSYAKERLAKFHGVSKTYFPLYLKEMEFRYNHRDNPQGLFRLLIQNLLNPVPKL
jgi:transposase